MNQASTKVRGWKGIAAALDVDRSTAIKIARRDKRLVVRQDHKGIYVDAAVIKEWLAANDRAYTAPTQTAAR